MLNYQQRSMWGFAVENRLAVEDCVGHSRVYYIHLAFGCNQTSSPSESAFEVVAFGVSTVTAFMPFVGVPYHGQCTRL